MTGPVYRGHPVQRTVSGRQGAPGGAIDVASLAGPRIGRHGPDAATVPLPKNRAVAVPGLSTTGVGTGTAGAALRSAVETYRQHAVLDDRVVVFQRSAGQAAHVRAVERKHRSAEARALEMSAWMLVFQLDTAVRTQQ